MTTEAVDATLEQAEAWLRDMVECYSHTSLVGPRMTAVLLSELDRLRAENAQLVSKVDDLCATVHRYQEVYEGLADSDCTCDECCRIRQERPESVPLCED